MSKGKRVKALRVMGAFLDSYDSFLEKGTVSDPQQEFIQYLSKHGLKLTPQRMTILEVLLQGGGHFTLEEMYQKVNEVDPSVGQATVYRTLKLLVEAGFADAVTFNDSITRYELRYGTEHHDHLICQDCGASIEFTSPKLEKELAAIAKKHGYDPTEHVVNIVGICKECRSKAKGKKRLPQ
jgi:Fur family ferric uptake transcriptional regulator